MKTPLINKIFIFLLLGLRPFFGPGQCKYSITCTNFARNRLQEHSLFSALWAILKRILSCNPFV